MTTGNSKSNLTIGTAQCSASERSGYSGRFAGGPVKKLDKSLVLTDKIIQSVLKSDEKVIRDIKEAGGEENDFTPTVIGAVGEKARNRALRSVAHDVAGSEVLL